MLGAMLLAPLLVLCITAPAAGHWARDETGRVSSVTLQAFDSIAQQLEDSGEGQLGLAVVKSTNGVPPRTFATEVFNAWGIGHAGRNDGVLLFFALDDRKSEIVYGDGFPADSSSDTDVVMRDDVVANMKAGRLDDAVTRAAASLARFVKRRFAPRESAPGTTPGTTPLDPEVKEKSPRGWTLDVGYALPADQEAALDREGDAVYASGKGQLFIAVFDTGFRSSRFAARLREKLHREDVWVVFYHTSGSIVVDAPGAKRIYEDVDRECRRIEALPTPLEAMHATGELIVNGPPAVPLTEKVSKTMEEHTIAFFGGFGGFGLVGLMSVRSWLRKRPRECANCGNPRHRLSEESDDPHLNPAQRLEEQLGSVDYDVWWCGRCNDALVLRYGAIFTSYSKCDSCGAKTASSSSVTLVEATYDHGGTVEVTERCKHCSYVHTYTRHTSRLERSDSSSSSWDSSSSSSFGGGSSSGGGSSGSW